MTCRCWPWGLGHPIQREHGASDGRPAAEDGHQNASAVQPLTGNYRTRDGRFIQLSMLQPTRYWPEFCRLMGCDGYADDPRFATLASLAENADAAFEIVEDAIASRTFAECVRLLKECSGPWAPVQDGWEVGNDESLIANGRIAEIVDADGHPQKLVVNPVKFDEAAPSLVRAPQFAEHTDEVLRELGFDDQQLVELKVAGAIT
ncbi:formyl-CoA transferase domain protein [Mycobacterium xenopi 4042]|uniref:Formyl-CoA transferase domain protein n=1 Tax=Mycobacterium xenopi 4042 TaxID=1299334 RepID=X8AF79_MYCXE|nr:formyl-CoA transferase domain protein [Mycobacterium xenopi 4042]